MSTPQSSGRAPARTDEIVTIPTTLPARLFALLSDEDGQEQVTAALAAQITSDPEYQLWHGVLLECLLRDAPLDPDPKGAAAFYAALFVARVFRVGFLFGLEQHPVAVLTAAAVVAGELPSHTDAIAEALDLQVFSKGGVR